MSEKKNRKDMQAEENRERNSKILKKETKQVKDLKKKISDLEELALKHTEENEKAKDQLLRTMAEFDNYKRRTDKEFIDNIQSAGREVIEDILPVISSIISSKNR